LYSRVFETRIGSEKARIIKTGHLSLNCTTIVVRAIVRAKPGNIPRSANTPTQKDKSLSQKSHLIPDRNNSRSRCWK